ncbi:hypothetical protein [Sphingomonas jatrophae]|uniref:Uncharacterized protein n=1 Tax=Sphingomonas jatrophae TaxID=1166337 RepID=A0A1I6KXU3_9SPHN|nr:hypothetical protein [Sphingomonas jatrophae]SFR96024.1 hypothetical protein SAMN05192580_1906 [Sphingomonas jatrophae]
MSAGIRTLLRRVALIVTVAFALTAPADARRFRIPIFVGGHGSSGASGTREVIDRVKDLPDTPAFQKDGEYLDVGFKYSQTLSSGRVESEDRGGGTYVLYHGDSYVALDSRMRSLLVSELGYDPIAGHDRFAPAGVTQLPGARSRAPLSAEAREARRDAARAAASWDGSNASSNIPGDPTAGQTRKSGSSAIGALFLAFMVIAGLVVLGIRRHVRGAAKVIAPLFAPGRDDPDTVAAGHGNFEARVAQRLVELQTDAAAPPPEARAAARVRSFGRKAA